MKQVIFFVMFFSFAPLDLISLYGDLHHLTQAEAERILGQPAKRTEEVADEENGVIRYKSTFTATTSDNKTSKTGNVYYLLEKYPEAASAKKAYADIVSSNAQMSGQMKLGNLGDEAWLHTDQHNFYLIMVRKNYKMIRIKVNAVTSTTSLDELQKVAGEIVSAW